jgi:ABC-type dipeptide/oligopeptide/nickel transport system ATPase component
VKSRLHKIEIRNFKAFREFTLNLEGRHLLVYGDNGAGKSSLFWALYTFLQSARKPTKEVEKYFAPGGPESLLNIHEQKEVPPRPGEIALTFRDAATKVDSTLKITKDHHETSKNPLIEKGDLASDFITYRFFFGFSDFRNSQTFNLWPLFEKEILPFCVSTRTVPETPLDWWNKIKSGNGNPLKRKGPTASKSYARLKRNTDEFATVLVTIVNQISDKAQEFYEKHFAADDPVKITLKLMLVEDKTTNKPITPTYNITLRKFTPPEIIFGIQIGTEAINRPQSFLNEAKLTQLALSIRFAASLVNLHDSDVKLLVLDDLLVSLDMSNRMKVVEILLTDAAFADYQKVILTHDLGLFEEFRRMIGSKSPEWGFYRLSNSSGLSSFKTEMETALEFLQQGQIAECGNRLRKCVETNLTTFLEQAKQKKGLDHLIDRESFASLHQKINETKNELSLGGYKEFAELLDAQFTLDQLRDLTSADEVDPGKFSAATKEEKKAKGKIIAKLYAARPNLHQCILDLLSDSSRKRLTAIKLLDEVQRIKNRILNPASHAGTSPLYIKEAEDAIKVIQALDVALTAALATI